MALDIFDCLMAEEQLSEEDPFFLAELLYTIKQKSLLRHLGYSKEQVESLLPTQRRLSLFRNLLYELSEDTGPDDLNSMNFLMRNVIAKKAETPLSLLACLEKQDKIGKDNLALLEYLSKEVKPILLKKINKYKSEKEHQVVVSPVNEGTKSLPQGEEERSPFSELKQLSETLPEADIYHMDGNFRGYCVIINNKTFTSLPQRQGTENDADCLNTVFTWLGFKTEVLHDVTKGQLDDILKRYKQHSGHARGDCFVFCVLTHGKCGEVYTSDGLLVPILDIISHFTLQQCPGLAHKPKLFFIQACQGKNTQLSIATEADAINLEHVNLEPLSLPKCLPNSVDILLGLSTVPGYVSYRHVEEGSWYIQSLCRHLRDMVPSHHDILTILTAVNKDVSEQQDLYGRKKQIPQPAFTLCKKLIFPVPPKK